MGWTAKQRQNVVRRLAQRDGWECHYCARPLTLEGVLRPEDESTPARATVDHVVPLTQGGSSRLSNLALACSPCNQDKGDKMPPGWGVTVNRDRLQQPLAPWIPRSIWD